MKDFGDNASLFFVAAAGLVGFGWIAFVVWVVAAHLLGLGTK